MNTEQKQIDTHTYPENASPLELARFQVAVIEAHANGAQIEMLDGTWVRVPSPSFRAFDRANPFPYRVARPKIAEGHNPAQLTVDQVGVKDGWRLLSVEERHHRDTLHWEPGPSGIFLWKRLGNGGWDDGWGNGTTDTYRTKAAPGFYLPKSAPVKTLRAWTFETAPKFDVWIRKKARVDISRITYISPSSGVQLYFNKALTDWAELASEYEHSMDGATWLPCGTYAEGQP
jgi:hypothetical protein